MKSKLNFSSKQGALVVAASIFGATAGLAACESSSVSGNVLVGGSYDIEDKVGGSDDDDDPTNNGNAIAGSYNGGNTNTHSHYDDLSANGGKDPFQVLKERQEEGTPSMRARLHSCQKIQIAALRNILRDLGVDLAKTSNPDSAGELLAEGSDALGGSNYAARQAEARTWTNSGATKLHDIFVQAASEVIENLPDATRCRGEDDEPVNMFDADDKCNRDAITCLLGEPATEEHLTICNHALESATDIEIGKQIAVAAILAGAHSCE